MVYELKKHTTDTNYAEQSEPTEGRKQTFKKWLNVTLAILTLLLAISDLGNAPNLWTIEAA